MAQIRPDSALLSTAVSLLANCSPYIYICREHNMVTETGGNQAEGKNMEEASSSTVWEILQLSLSK